MTEPVFDANGWATSDSAPKNAAGYFEGPKILGYNERFGVPVPVYWGMGEDGFGCWVVPSHGPPEECEISPEDITHWRPLPKPPVGT